MVRSTIPLVCPVYKASFKRQLENNVVTVGEKSIARSGHGRLPFVRFVFIGAFDNGDTSGGGFFSPDPSGAVIAGKLLNLERLDPLDDVVKLWIPCLKERNMQTTVTTVGFISLKIFAGIGEQR